MHRFYPSLVAGLILVLLGSVVPSTGTPVALGAAMQAEPGVQVLYVVPDGKTADPVVLELIPPAIDAIQDFLRQDIGRTLQMRPDIITHSVTNGTPQTMRDELLLDGFDDLNTVFLVFAETDGLNPANCGIATNGALDEPNFAWVMMENCMAPRVAGPQQFPFGVTYLALHELLHALGAVPSCGPNEDGTGHVSDSPYDILYQGPEPREWFSLTIDVGNDDYYSHGRRDCPDIAGSVFWDNTLPPGPLCSGRAITIDMSTNGGSGIGTAGPDVIAGTAGDDYIDGGGGNDIVCAGAGDDVVIGGDGNDLIFGGDGHDTVTGGSGNDSIFGENGRDLLRGNEDRDQLDGGAGADRLLGGIDDDHLEGGNGDDFLSGFGGEDRIDGGNGDDTIYGGFGADDIDAGPGDDAVHGLVGNDVISGGSGNDVLDGDRGNDTVNGGPDNDIIRGGNANDVLFGGAGDDQVRGGKADDQLSGGDGNDLCAGNTETVSDSASADCETVFGVP